MTLEFWSSAARFCNWLHNGTPRGAQDNSTTEDGAYTLTGRHGVALGDDPIFGANGRNVGARFHLPSENQWYKAAYHDPRTEAERGPVGDDHYWLYPTQSDDVPTAEEPPGGSNSANYASAVTGTTIVGAYRRTTSYFGAFDMGGNVSEWIEESLRGGYNVHRGGSYASRPVDDIHLHPGDLASPEREETKRKRSSRTVGFRVASP